MQVCDFGTIDSMTGGLMLVSVTLVRSHSIIGNILKFLIQKQSDTKSREIRKLFIFLSFN